MSHYINKIVEHYCSKCKTITDMEIITKESELNIYWLKCKACYEAVMIKKDELDKKEIRNKNKKLTNLNQNEKRIKEYKPSGTYKLGQKLYHPGFKDQGKIIKIKPGSGDFEKIIVKFDNIGKKMLIQGIPTEESQ